MPEMYASLFSCRHSDKPSLREKRPHYVLEQLIRCFKPSNVCPFQSFPICFHL